MAAETATADRLDAMRQPGLVLALTRHRAETLKARPYDGDVARISCRATAGLGWLRAMADPAMTCVTP